VLIGLEEAPGRPDGELTDHARQVITSLRAYLMAKKAGEPAKHEADPPWKKILLPMWKTQ
jgi:hypothetical protein